MVKDGVLSPVISGEFISERSRHVKIHPEGIEKLCEEVKSTAFCYCIVKDSGNSLSIQVDYHLKILSSLKDNKLQIPDTNTASIHPNKDHPQAVDWVFVADTLNFCFWSNNKDEQWTVDGYTGYFALEAALHRALKEGYDITNPEYYSRITEEELKHIFRGDTDAKIPLFDQRIAVLHEVGTILIKKYNKTFETCVKEANKSAVKLLKIVVENFPCFCDEALYQERKVSLYKRAQILIADLWSFLEGNGWGEFQDIDKLTMFADYRVPQVLVYFGAMSYSDELMDKLKNDILLPSGSTEEVEIRGCSIHTIELLKQRLKDRISKEKLNVDVPNSSLLDYYLWCYRRKHAAEMEKIPYHKTLGIYY